MDIFKVAYCPQRIERKRHCSGSLHITTTKSADIHNCPIWDTVAQSFVIISITVESVQAQQVGLKQKWIRLSET